MEKKEIIYELAKGIQCEIIGNGAKYAGYRRKLRKNGISEIGLYSTIAEYLEENDIKPEKFLDETMYAINELCKNPFAIKTDNNLAYLYNRYESLKFNAVDKTRFLCNKCFHVKAVGELPGTPNYPHTCKTCIAKLSKDHYKNKKQQEPEKPQVPQEVKEAKEEIAQVIVCNEPIESFGLEIDTISGDGDVTMVNLMVPTQHLSKFLDLVTERK